MPKFDVVTIGSATRDVFIESDEIKSIQTNEFMTGEGICIPAGSKISIDSIHFATGGSAVNTAITFSQLGFKTAIICKISGDLNGDAILERLSEVGVDVKNVLIENGNHQTGYSIIIHPPDGARTIFVYRGASSEFSLKEFNFNILKKTQWIYITHLGGQSAEIFEPLINFAHENGVKVALNPGSTQLNLGDKLISTLDKVDILFVNQEEAAILTGTDYKKEDELFRKLDEWVRGIAVMTKGPEGVMVSDGKTRWEAGILKEPVFVDRTGAGDAFASGFTTAIARGNNVEDAIELGSANATSVLGEWGANYGLLKKNDLSDKFGKLEIKVTNL